MFQLSFYQANIYAPIFQQGKFPKKMHLTCYKLTNLLQTHPTCYRLTQPVTHSPNLLQNHTTCYRLTQPVTDSPDLPPNQPSSQSRPESTQASSHHPHSLDNLEPGGTHALTHALLGHRTTLDPVSWLTPAQVIFGQSLRDFLLYNPGRY